MGRIIVFGDEKQSIHGFRGADIHAFDNFRQMLQSRTNGCKSFPLSTCRRCPRSHIRLAQALVPDIRWCVKERDGIDAPEGEIYQLSQGAAIEMMQAGDLGVSRVNKVLIPVCYTLIRAKKKAIIRGRDIGKGLLGLINKLRPKSIEDLLLKLRRYAQRETRKLLVVEGLLAREDSFDTDFDYLAVAHKSVDEKTLKKTAQKFQNVVDKVGCIEALTDGVDDLPTLRQNIEKIFAEFDDNGRPIDAIVLGTVHRTKGLESHNVFVIDPENFPHKLARRPWEIEQEQNLAYVAATRSKFQLDDKGGVLQPGRLVFMGSCPAVYKARWLQGAKYPVSQDVHMQELVEEVVIPEEEPEW
jgi:DNA helicase II / ATP-dependent DNA helicase PcrA